LRKAGVCDHRRMVDDAGQDAGQAPAWTASAVAAHLGVSVVTLRSWARRYGLTPNGHVAGRHRRYGPADVARLEQMRRLVARGMSAKDAALLVQSEPVTPLGHDGSGAATDGPRSAGEASSARSEAAERAPTTSRAVAAMVAAALRLDADSLENALGEHLRERGVIDTWDELCVPVLARIGQRHAERGDCVDAEHLLSWTIASALRGVAGGSAGPGGRTAVLACVADEWHTLAMEALRAALAERGVTSRMLGAATPSAALAAAISRTQPGVVVVWAQTGRTARPSLLAGPLTALREQRPTPGLLLAGGLGWTTRRLPKSVTRVESLRSAMLLSVGALASPI
jgi:MerR family transcriptional regulator, light-induced transcriptional regulator